MSVDQALARAAKLARSGAEDEAKKIYLEILQRFPANKRASDGLQSLAGRQLGPPREDIQFLTAALNQGRFEDVVRRASDTLRQAPRSAEVYNITGAALWNLKRFDEALSSFDKALQIKPDLPASHNGRGIALHALNRYREALASYDRAIELNARFADAWNNRSNTLQDLGRLDEALESCKRALEIVPNHVQARNNLGNILWDLGRLDEALLAHDEVLRLKPDPVVALNQIYKRAHICAWERGADGTTGLSKLQLEGAVVSPSVLMLLEDDPQRHLAAARAWADAHFRPVRYDFARPAERPDRLRIGYFSADFHDHATMHLMARVLELHDETKFEVHAFSYGVDLRDAMWSRVLAAVDGFHDVRELSDAGAAELSRKLGIDLAIDLKGYTKHGRVGIFANRAAPVQINYLGYPGSLGASFIDYMIADRTLVPAHAEELYSEKILFLPDSYQANDNQRLMSDKRYTRSECGLPESGFVFCCFNNNFKITPLEFDIWMRLLLAVDGSVLWLLRDNRWAEENLRREASARGIDPRRLVFAERVPLADHLARHRCADLFLDTFVCNAHTTASDALWTGLPVVTTAGKGLAARVAASLLRAIRLPELATDTSHAYEMLALELAQHPTRLAEVRAKLAANRLTTPLFDSETFTRHLERAYDLAYQRRLEGLAPDHIHVA